MPEGASSPWVDLSGGNADLQALLDTDGDGMPDVWERKHGLDPENPADGPAVTLSREGYTNLEVYLNEGL